MYLEKDFYLQDAVSVAKKLIGKLLIRNIRNIKKQKVVCRIVETEAYMGTEDKASHAYQNKYTQRTEVMFRSGGYAYIYLIYGMYHCFNIVTGEEGNPEAVLVRAVEPLAGINIIKENRNIKSNKREELTNGPGKLCQALKINKSLNGHDLTKGEGLYLKKDCNKNDIDVRTGKRINIDYAEEYREKLWRFYVKDNSYVSN